MRKIWPLLGVLTVLGLAGVGIIVTRLQQQPRQATTTGEAAADTETTVLPSSGPNAQTPASPPASAPLLTLTLTSPKANATVTSSSLTVKGKTSPKAEIFVNEAETVADANGNFSVTVELEEGENYLLVAVTDADGNYKEQELTVTYNAGE